MYHSMIRKMFVVHIPKVHHRVYWGINPPPLKNATHLCLAKVPLLTSAVQAPAS